MRFIPLTHHTIKVDLSVNTATALLSNEIEHKKRFWPNPFADDRKRFVGSMSDGGFRIIRNVYYLNSFLPFIKGSISASDTGSVVSFTTAGNPAVITAFMLVPAFFGWFLTSFLMESAPVFLVALATIVGLLLGYTAYALVFKAEERIDKDT